MGSIILRNLKSTTKVNKATYIDLHLDLVEDVVLSKGIGTSFPRGRDIQVSYDEEAIKNSLTNIFNTIPGERFLIPEFGANLRQYLFRPVTESTANQIGRVVLDAVERWEPRVTVENVNVVGKPFGSTSTKDTGRYTNLVRSTIPNTEDEYDVTIIISIPALRKRTKLEGILTEAGFAEIRIMSI